MKKISLKDVKDGLKRDELRSIRGGCGAGCRFNMCCWAGTNNCSACSTGTICVPGAVLRPCC